jgi:hypothetical protein
LLSINKGNNYLKVKNESNIEEEIDRLKNKMDKFKIWKEKFSIINLLMNILDLSKTKYAIQTKKHSYLIWKFKFKWKIIGEMHTQQNIIISEGKFSSRKKRCRKLNILANIFDIGIKFETDTNLHEIINKEIYLPLSDYTN